MINIEDFKKVEIKIGKIVSAEKIPEGDKLLKLTVDFGSETRQIMSGIAKFFPDPAVLVGRQMPFVTNLEPRMLLGYESQGMILASDSPDGPVLLHPDTEVPPGSVLK
ncbi:MAG: methionine--tRNA ligase [Candidatus Pacebacteria bacterium]|nr:methionine--tRNA ligase [Candidatus Paceibacterota bacterium]